MSVEQGSRDLTTGNQGRLLGRALAASIVAHALILSLVPSRIDKPARRPSAPPPLVAHLIQPRPPPAPAPEPVENRVRPEAPRKPPAVERAQSIEAAPAAPAAVPAPVAAVPPPAGDSSRATDPAPAPISAPTPAPVARVEPAPPIQPAAPPAADFADPATLGQYRIAIISAARRYKRYPRLAIDNNWEGQAEIRMVIGIDGNIASISIKSRSGFEVLDQQALDMIRKAMPLTPIPPALRGKGFTVDVPVVFSLKEEAG